jgi:Protein of unknown function (DUF4242)
MPTFLDHHAMPSLSPEAAEGIAERIRAGDPDEFGAKALNVYLGKNGTAFCLSEAPNAEAVVNAHAAAGFPIAAEDVVEVEAVAAA